MLNRREARLHDFAVLLSDRITAISDVAANRERNKDTFRAFADTLPCIIWTATASGEVTWFNRYWHELFGNDGREWQTQIHPDDLQHTLDVWGGCVTTGSPFYHYSRVRDARGVFQPIVSHAHPIRDEAGRVLYWIGQSSMLAEAPSISRIQAA